MPRAEAAPVDRRRRHHPPLPPDVEDFLGWLSAVRGRSPNTIAAYRRDLRAWCAHLESRGLEPADAEADDVAAHLQTLTAEGRAATSRRRSIASIRALHRFLVLEELAPDDPARTVSGPREPRQLPKALSVAEVDRLFTSVVGNDALAQRDLLVLELLYGTGIRVSELIGVSSGDIDRQRGVIRVLGKGNKERSVPIGRPLGEALDTWEAGGRHHLIARQGGNDARDDRSALVLNHRGQRISRQGIWLILKRRGEQVGLANRLTPHVLRHSCATHMIEHGADVRTVQALLGHASISTTQLYTHVTIERLQRVHSKAHPRAEAPPARS